MRIPIAVRDHAGRQSVLEDERHRFLEAAGDERLVPPRRQGGQLAPHRGEEALGVSLGLLEEGRCVVAVAHADVLAALPGRGVR